MSDLKALSEKATQGVWGIWFEQINGKADAAIQELIDQVHHTDPIGQSLVMLDADGKCPAITGCGPTSSANAAFIVALVNAHRTGQLVEMPSVDELAGVIYRNSWDPVAEEAGHIAQAIIAHLEGKRG